MFDVNSTEYKNKALVFFKSLSPNERINLKACVCDFTNMTWDEFLVLFSPAERLSLVYQKLEQMELVN